MHRRIWSSKRGDQQCKLWDVLNWCQGCAKLMPGNIDIRPVTLEIFCMRCRGGIEQFSLLMALLNRAPCIGKFAGLLHFSAGRCGSRPLSHINATFHLPVHQCDLIQCAFIVRFIVRFIYWPCVRPPFNPANKFTRLQQTVNIPSLTISHFSISHNKLLIRTVTCASYIRA